MVFNLCELCGCNCLNKYRLLECSVITYGNKNVFPGVATMPGKIYDCKIFLNNYYELVY